MIYLLWKNSKLRVCYLRYAFEPESTENSLRECQRLEQEVDTLKPHVDISSGKEIAYAMLPTMVDGKVKFVWSQTTASLNNCYVCGAKPKELSKRESDKFAPDRKALRFGFSNLHVKLRSFDYICKTSINRDFKCHQCVAANAGLQAVRKDELVTRFKTHFGYTLYDGFGAAKNGHIARAAFARPLLFSEVTAVPLFIIMGIKTAIEAIDCPKRISPEKYAAFANQWLDDFHESGWEWSWLSPTVHMIFHHGADIFRIMPVPTSLLTGHVTFTEIMTNLLRISGPEN